MMRGVGWVYFITWADDAPVKIGCTQNPDSRLAGLQTAHPYKLYIAGVYPGNPEKEREIHRRFRGSRLEGEWFKRGPVLNELIAESEQEWWPVNLRDELRVNLATRVHDDEMSGVRIYLIRDQRDGVTLLKTKHREVAEQYQEMVDGKTRREAVRGALELAKRGWAETRLTT